LVLGGLLVTLWDGDGDGDGVWRRREGGALEVRTINEPSNTT
jgi:hypothetical protein